jgi:hypothetical protein
LRCICRITRYSLPIAGCFLAVQRLGNRLKERRALVTRERLRGRQDHVDLCVGKMERHHHAGSIESGTIVKMVSITATSAAGS